MSKGPRATPRPAPKSQRTTYSIEFLNSAASEFEKLNAKMQKRIGSRIDALSDNPRPDGCTKLKGSTNTYRIRVRDYRVLYDVEDKRVVVIVIKVGHRRDDYR